MLEELSAPHFHDPLRGVVVDEVSDTSFHVDQTLLLEPRVSPHRGVWVYAGIGGVITHRRQSGAGVLVAADHGVHYTLGYLQVYRFVIVKLHNYFYFCLRPYISVLLLNRRYASQMNSADMAMTTENTIQNNVFSDTSNSNRYPWYRILLIIIPPTVEISMDTHTSTPVVLINEDLGHRMAP